MAEPTKQPVLVCTQHRGVFAGLIDPDQISERSVSLTSARMAIRWGTTKGVHELAETGPTNSSRISAPADILALHDVTAIFSVTEEAWAVWQRS